MATMPSEQARQLNGPSQGPKPLKTGWIALRRFRSWVDQKEVLSEGNKVARASQPAGTRGYRLRDQRREADMSPAATRPTLASETFCSPRSTAPFRPSSSDELRRPPQVRPLDRVHVLAHLAPEIHARRVGMEGLLFPFVGFVSRVVRQRSDRRK